MTTKVYIANNKLDLFEDENIELVSSVLDISDISKNTTDYTKSFTVPASKNNNKTFKHYYDADIDNSFDARIKIEGRIELDGTPFKVGKFRLQKVSVKKGKPSSYTINFFGNITDIAKTLNKDKLRGLDLSTYDHVYTSANVLIGLTSSLSSGAIVYNPLVKKDYFYNADSADNTQTETTANIALGGGDDTGIVWSDLRPSIKLIKIIEAIEADYSLEFSRDFFGTSEFQNLFMWCNPDGEKDLGAYSQRIDWDGGSSVWMNHTTDEGIYTTSYPTASTPVGYRFEVDITPDAGFENVEYTIKMFNNDEEWAKTIFLFVASYVIFPSEGDASFNNTVYFTVETTEPFEFTAELTQTEINGVFGPIAQTEVTTATTNTISGEVVIAENMPDLEIIEFLKGLFSMFKLVIVPEDDGTFYVDTLASFYSKGTLYDITKYIDFDSYDVDRGTLLNEISFKFEEPTTIGNIQFEKNAGNFYGDDEIQFKDDNDVLLDGDSLEVTVPFEQVQYERLIDVNSSEATNIQYGAIIDESLEPVSPKAHIFYNINQSLGYKLVGFQNDLGLKESIGANINIPSHTYPIELNNYATIFRDEFSTWDGVKIQNNLYSNHWSDYVLNIFNIKKREFKFKAILPLRILSKLDLNEILQIKTNYYRIDKFSHNLLTGETTFNLVNSFDNTINNFSSSDQNIVTDYVAKTETAIVTDLQNSTYVKVDTGDGVGWATVTDSGNILSFSFNENSVTTSPRSMTVRTTQTATGKTIDILLTQTSTTITFDSDLVTFDSDLITFDSGY